MMNNKKLIKIFIIISLCFFLTSCESNKERLETKLQQIKNLIEKRNIEQASKQLEILKSTSPDNIEIDLLYAEIEYINKNYNKVIRLLKKLETLENENVKYWVMLIESYNSRGEEEIALEKANLFLKKYNQNDEILLLTSKIYTNKHLDEKSLLTLLNVHDKENAEYLKTISKVYLKQEKFSLVAECYQKLITKKISEDEIISYLTFIGKYHYILKDYNKACESFQKANEINNSMIKIKIYQGVCHHLLNEKEKSKELIYSAFLLNPKNKQVDLLLNGTKKEKHIILQEIYKQMEDLYE